MLKHGPHCVCVCVLLTVIRKEEFLHLCERVVIKLRKGRPPFCHLSPPLVLSLSLRFSPSLSTCGGTALNPTALTGLPQGCLWQRHPLYAHKYAHTHTPTHALVRLIVSIKGKNQRLLCCAFGVLLRILTRHVEINVRSGSRLDRAALGEHSSGNITSP